jgi:hypothetical protein
MPESRPEQARELAEGNTGLWHLELDVARPGAREGARSGKATGGILKTGEFIEKSGGDDFAGKASGRQCGRCVKRLDHHTA